MVKQGTLDLFWGHIGPVLVHVAPPNAWLLPRFGLFGPQKRANFGPTGGPSSPRNGPQCFFPNLLVDCRMETIKVTPECFGW